VLVAHPASFVEPGYLPQWISNCQSHAEAEPRRYTDKRIDALIDAQQRTDKRFDRLVEILSKKGANGHRK